MNTIFQSCPNVYTHTHTQLAHDPCEDALLTQLLMQSVWVLLSLYVWYFSLSLSVCVNTVGHCLKWARVPLQIGLQMFCKVSQVHVWSCWDTDLTLISVPSSLIISSSSFPLYLRLVLSKEKRCRHNTVLSYTASHGPQHSVQEIAGKAGGGGGVLGCCQGQRVHTVSVHTRTV